MSVIHPSLDILTAFDLLTELIKHNRNRFITIEVFEGILFLIKRRAKDKDLKLSHITFKLNSFLFKRVLTFFMSMLLI